MNRLSRVSNSGILWIIIVLALPAFIITNHFTNIFKCPSCYLYEDSGDGLKNYYTLAYYVQHDKGWHFSGMNYPYGENIIYTDNQPILAITLSWIDRHIMDLDRHVVGILNLLLLISLYCAVLLTYALLRRWKVGKVWSLASACCIIFLSPQLWRFHGHYALAYVGFLPLMFLMLDHLVRDEKKKILWTGMISSLVIVMSLTHMYFLLLSLVVLAGFTLFWWWYNRKQKVEIKFLLPFLVATIIIPAMIMIGIKSGTDDIKDRPIEPWGIDSHTVTFETTFFPFIPPMDKMWTEILKREKPIFERIAYTGLIGLLMLPVIVFFLFSKNKDEEGPDTHVKAFLGAAIISWMMAGGVIYQNGFKFLWEAIPLLKQFRGLGRFGIPFYYLYTLVCSYLLWKFYLKLKNRDLGAIASYTLFAVLLVWSFEAWLNIKAVAAPVFHQNKYLSDARDDYVPLLATAGYKPEQFQAILQLPLVAIGSETMGVARGFWTFREGIHASMETGLPMIDYAMSRTSVSQGMDIVELLSSPYTEKRRGKLLDDRPLLLVCEEEFVLPGERRWIDKAQKIGTYNSITLYSLSSDVFKKIEPPHLQMDSLKKTVCTGIYEGFENYKSDTTMSGEGAIRITSAPQSIWSYIDTTSLAKSYQVSFWSRVDNLKGNMPVPRMMETNPEGTITQNTGLHREAILWSEAYGPWIEVSFPFTFQGNGYKYDLFIDNAGPVIDNLLVRPVTDTCVINTNEMLLINNLPVPHSR
ncbi:MAG: hypothetical protein M3R25_06680 [Bacteroidota bacterium]|nr:hypothetical protein [Bacteroidota bacterium]